MSLVMFGGLADFDLQLPTPVNICRGDRISFRTCILRYRSGLPWSDPIRSSQDEACNSNPAERADLARIRSNGNTHFLCQEDLPSWRGIPAVSYMRLLYREVSRRVLGWAVIQFQCRWLGLVPVKQGVLSAKAL